MIGGNCTKLLQTIIFLEASHSACKLAHDQSTNLSSVSLVLSKPFQSAYVHWQLCVELWQSCLPITSIGFLCFIKSPDYRFSLHCISEETNSNWRASHCSTPRSFSDSIIYRMWQSKLRKYKPNWWGEVLHKCWWQTTSWKGSRTPRPSGHACNCTIGS